jgi:hypothetical protein
MKVPYTTPATWPKLTPARFASTIRTDRPDGCAIALLGLPDDTGVKMNYGRSGAAKGPVAF